MKRTTIKRNCSNKQKLMLVMYRPYRSCVLDWFRKLKVSYENSKGQLKVKKRIKWGRYIVVNLIIVKM